MAQEPKIKISGVAGPNPRPGIDSPHANDTVNNPFQAFGTVDPPGTAVTGAVQSHTTGQRFLGTSAAPPSGEDWALNFNVLVPDDYTLLVRANGSSASVDPIHVI